MSSRGGLDSGFGGGIESDGDQEKKSLSRDSGGTRKRCSSFFGT